MIRIVVLSRIVNGHGVSGGLEAHGESLVRCLVQLGHQPTVITTRHPSGVPTEEFNGVLYQYLSHTRPAMYSGGWWAESHRALDALYESASVDVVCAQGAAGEMVARSREERALPIVTILHGTWETELESAVAQLLRSLRVPSTRLRTSLRRSMAMLHHTFLWRAYIEKVDRVIAVSHTLASNVLRRYRVDPSRVLAVPNGIDHSMFYPDPLARQRVISKHDLPEDARLVLVPGRVEEEKGVQVAIEAILRLKEKWPLLRLVVAGDGPFLPALERQRLKARFLDTVSLLGRVPRSGMLDYYNAADLVVIPTLRVEGLPFVLLEAMACGRAVVATRIGGIPSALTDGVHGLLSRPGDAAELAQRIDLLLANDALRISLGRTARAHAVDQYSEEASMRRIAEVLVECK